MAAPKLPFTVADYEAMEAASSTRHELVDGEVFAMAGGTRAHNYIGSAFVRHLGNAMDAAGCGCFAFGSDMRVAIDDVTHVYPDAVVVCPPIEAPSEDACSVSNPVIVVEVVSPSSATWDVLGKRERYARLPSLQHYLVAQTAAWRIEHFRRMSDGSWRVSTHGPDDTLHLDALAITLRVEDVYRGVDGLGGPARDARPPGPAHTAS